MTALPNGTSREVRDGVASTANDDVLTIAGAQASLDDARDHLDAAVMSLAETDGDTVMADARLVALLFRVAVARRHLEEVAVPAQSCAQSVVRWLDR